MAQAGQTFPVAQGVTSTTTMLLEMSAPVESSATAPQSCFVQSMSAWYREMGTMPTLHICSHGNTVAARRPSATAPQQSCFVQCLSAQIMEMGTMPTLHICSHGNTAATQWRHTDKPEHSLQMMHPAVHNLCQHKAGRCPDAMS